MPKDYQYSATQKITGNVTTDYASMNIPGHVTIKDAAQNKKALFDALRELMKEGYTKFEVEVKDRDESR